MCVCFSGQPRQKRPNTANARVSLQMKDLMCAVDVASAEISYEKEAGVQTSLKRPKTAAAQLASPHVSRYFGTYMLIKSSLILLLKIP